MSTYQPPGGGQQSDGTPGYAQPQDPWEGGYEPGLASVPTDPIPQQQQSYGAGYPPPYTQDEVWSQPTVGGYPGYVPPNRTPKIVLATLLVILLAGGGGFLAWYLIKNPPGGGGGGDNPSASATVTTPNTTPNTTPTTPGNTAVAFDPFTVKVGDCLVNDNPNVPNDPKMRVVPCDRSATFEVLTIVTGADIPQDDDGQISESESQEACKNSGYTNYYQSNSDGVDRDVVFCMKAL